jgi:FLVCR family feline leukemia virus subgroup C receptor-related protein
MTGYLGIGYEYAAELTYPIPEGTSSGLLFTLAGGEIFEIYHDRVTNTALIVVLAIGFIMTMFVSGTLKRHIISKESKEKHCIKDESQMA